MKILLAEDGKVNQMVAVNLLQELGHEVTVAVNGREAIEHFDAGAFEAILMDVEMPEMDGIEATAAIREMEKANDSHIPIIAMTANTMEGDRERFLEASMDDYVPKPLSGEALSSVLDRVTPGEG